VYITTPILIYESWIENVPGVKFADYVFKISSQNNPNLSFESYTTNNLGHKINYAVGEDVKISGSGNFFTVFLIRKDGAERAMVYSGEKTSTGIKDFRWG
jgi:hypothetical protein